MGAFRDYSMILDYPMSRPIRPSDYPIIDGVKVCHFAFFDRLTGEYIDDYFVELPVNPPINQTLVGDERSSAMNKWAHSIVPYPRKNCVGLDVTVLDYPCGSYVWMSFDIHARRLSDPPNQHLYAEIDRITGRLSHYCRTSRPVISDEKNICIDVTGTLLHKYYQEHGPLYGNFIQENERLIFHQDSNQKALNVASSDLEVENVSRPAEYERVHKRAGIEHLRESKDEF